GATPVDALVREPERAELLDLQLADDVALADDDLTDRDLHLDGHDGIARVLLREARRGLVGGHVRMEVLPQELGADALLSVGPRGRNGLERVGLHRVELLGTDPLPVERAERAV